VNYLDARIRARDALRKANMQSLQSALELYRSDQSAYPAALPACGNPLRDPANTTTYISKVPCDPTNTAPHTYTYSLAGSIYTLRACLENERDGQRDTTNIAPCDGTTNVSYTVTTQ
jgi:type II secretory pathway pseudopilin PulG